MRHISWDPEKNEKLKAERSVSFDDVLYAIDQGFLLDTIEHPNAEKYSHQRIYVVLINQYVYTVPFVEDEKSIFLKTIIPSRKLTKKYMAGGD